MISGHPSGLACRGRAISTAPEAEPARHLASGSRSPPDGNRLASADPPVVQQELSDERFFRPSRFLLLSRRALNCLRFHFCAAIIFCMIPYSSPLGHFAAKR